MVRRLVALCAVAALAAGCASTSRTDDRFPDPPGASAAPGASIEPGTATTAPSAGGATREGSSRSAANEASSGRSDGSRPRVAAPGGPVGPGVTAKEIHIGVMYALPAGAGLEAIGVEGSFGDGRRYAEIMIEDINKRGGIAGRKLTATYFGVDANPGAAPLPAQEESACAALTQDVKSFAIIGWSGSEEFKRCVKKAGTIQVNDGNGPSGSKAVFSRYPANVDISSINLDRLADLEVPALQRLKYFTPWNTASGGPGAMPVKVGVFTYDLPEFRHAVDKVLQPALKKIKRGPAEVAYVAPHDSYGNLSAASGQIQSAVLRFRSAGVTHIILMDDNGIIGLFLLTHANSQGYHPRYGINTGSNFQVVITAAPKEQARGAVGIGWIPILDDQRAQNDNGPYSNPERRACVKLMTSKGADVSDRGPKRVAMNTCTMLRFLKTTVQRAPSLAAGGFVTAVNGLGSGFRAASTPLTSFAARRHDGVAGVYDLGYDETCGCMKYRSGVRRLGASVW